MEQEEHTPDELIAEYIRLRDAKKMAEEKVQQFMRENFHNRMEAIEATLHHQLNTAKADSIKTAAGTVFKKTETSVTVPDKAAFQRHVIGTEDWDLVDMRANKTAVEEFVNNNDGLLPPGVNMTKTEVVSIRRPS